MELKKFIKLVLASKKNIAFWGILGGIIGLAIFYYPSKYVTTGSFFVKRAISQDSGFFTYEGYYGQQTALAFTNTAAALLESEQLQSAALHNIGIEVDEKSLHRYSKFIKVKKSSPQLITLTVKGNSYQESEKLWLALSNELSKTVREINKDGDRNLSVGQVSDNPVVKKAYKSIFVDFTAGILLGTVLGVFLISYKEYD